MNASIARKDCNHWQGTVVSFALMVMSRARLFRRRGKMVAVLLAVYRGRGGRIMQNAIEMLVPSHQEHGVSPLSNRGAGKLPPRPHVNRLHDSIPLR